MSEPIIEIYLLKSEDSLAGAVSEFANGRFDNCANRAYYACFQAAIAALVREGVGPPGKADQWGHDYVQARFTGELFNRRKRHPAALGEALIRGLRLRLLADYKNERVTEVQASRALARARQFVTAITADERRRS
jgi:uncharacterized protein (UPF0332 family)